MRKMRRTGGRGSQGNEGEYDRGNRRRGEEEIRDREEGEGVYEMINSFITTVKTLHCSGVAPDLSEPHYRLKIRFLGYEERWQSSPKLEAIWGWL